jgi:hypothetical protein
MFVDVSRTGIHLRGCSPRMMNCTYSWVYIKGMTIMQHEWICTISFFGWCSFFLFYGIKIKWPLTKGGWQSATISSSIVKNPHLSHLFCTVKIDLYEFVCRQFFSLWVICVFSDIVWQCPVCHMWLSVTPYIICSNFHFWKQKIQAICSLFNRPSTP